MTGVGFLKYRPLPKLSQCFVAHTRTATGDCTESRPQSSSLCPTLKAWCLLLSTGPG